MSKEEIDILSVLLRSLWNVIAKDNDITGIEDNEKLFDKYKQQIAYLLSYELDGLDPEEFTYVNSPYFGRISEIFYEQVSSSTKSTKDDVMKNFKDLNLFDIDVVADIVFMVKNRKFSCEGKSRPLYMVIRMMKPYIDYKIFERGLKLAQEWLKVA